MGFYEDFVEKYDLLVSWENRFKREHKFFNTLLSKYQIKSILDCACGTGQHVVMFHQMGIIAKGSDLSPAMVKKAKINARKYKVKADFKVADFRNLSKVFKEKFDAVVCVGNSLPHLLSDRDLKKAIHEMGKVLNPKGLLILQQRNYDMLIGSKKRFFNMATRENEAFFYVLDYLPNKIVFNIVNLDTKSKKFKVYTTDYNPLKKAKLVRLLKECGFNRFEFYGDYDFNKFDLKKGNDLIMICKKSS
ncbi:MAG: class I SAM-dependent methyltransferase [Deltaproteobacteria bacterium]|nr:MAG: class I SAM-dependent methyltransferase [Deltaproteobacteria bacterium]